MGLNFVGIPIYSLAKYRGMADAVKDLRSAGIVQRLESADNHLADLGDIYCPQIDRDHGPRNLQNFEEFLEGTRRVKDKLSGVDRSKLTFSLGGDCTLIVGTLAGLKTVHKGRLGVVWLDAHGDFNTPETSPSGFIGGMPLALACGRGPRLSDEIEASKPLLDEGHVVHIGSRALDPGEEEALLSSIEVFTAKEVKKSGAEKVALQGARFLSDRSDWILAHLDVDVLSPSVMPGVNFPEPGGLAEHDILEVLHALHSTGKLRAIDLTAYNPARDPNKHGQSLLLDLVPRLVKPK